MHYLSLEILGNQRNVFSNYEISNVLSRFRKFASHINTLFRITHASGTTFAVSLQSLMLLFHVCTSPKFMGSSTISPADTPLAGSMTTLPSRFFRTLYASLLDSRLSYSASSSKHASYLNLLLKAVKSDPDVQNKAVLTSVSGFLNKDRKTGKLRNEANSSKEVIAPKRPSALTKRYLQTLVSGTGSGGRNEVMCAGLFFVGQVSRSFPCNKSFSSYFHLVGGIRPWFDTAYRQSSFL